MTLEDRVSVDGENESIRAIAQELVYLEYVKVGSTGYYQIVVKDGCTRHVLSQSSNESVSKYMLRCMRRILNRAMCRILAEETETY